MSELWSHKRVGSKERILSELILDFLQTTNGLGIGHMLWKKLLSPAPASISKAIRFFEVASALALRSRGHAYLPHDKELETGQLLDDDDEEAFAARQPAEVRAKEGPAADRSTEHPLLIQDVFGSYDDASGSRTGDIRANAPAEQATFQSSPLTQTGSSPQPVMHPQAELVIPSSPSSPSPLSTNETEPRGTKRKRGKAQGSAPLAPPRRHVTTVPATGPRTRSQAKPQ